MDCPKCHFSMSIIEKMGVEIDYCPHCFGIWLDKGELNKLIEQVGDYYSNKQNYNMDFENYGYGDKDYYIRHPNRAKKSYLSRFFDFDI